MERRKDTCDLVLDEINVQHVLKVLVHFFLGVKHSLHGAIIVDLLVFVEFELANQVVNCAVLGASDSFEEQICN